MTYEIQLINSQEKLLLDKNVYDYLASDPELTEIDFLNTLEVNSKGTVVFKQRWKEEDGSYIFETTYLHKLIADKFLPRKRNNQILAFRNGNQLDCRLENMEYRNRLIAKWN
ncbi:MAG TPA: hypothetical protein ENK85_11540 [Saprospiraceae bacterium]|nr:hypothetical protein [Saprospiraceae bacterium]